MATLDTIRDYGMVTAEPLFVHKTINYKHQTKLRKTVLHNAVCYQILIVYQVCQNVAVAESKMEVV